MVRLNLTPIGFLVLSKPQSFWNLIDSIGDFWNTRFCTYLANKTTVNIIVLQTTTHKHATLEIKLSRNFFLFFAGELVATVLSTYLIMCQNCTSFCPVKRSSAISLMQPCQMMATTRGIMHKGGRSEMCTMKSVLTILWINIMVFVKHSDI